MTDTHTNLTQRKEALEAKMAPLLAKLAPLQIQHARVCLALDAVALLKPAEKNAGFFISRKERPLKPLGTIGIKRMVIEILKSHPEGLKALDILSSIKEIYSIEIMRTSLSPQLSRLKRAGRIENNGKLWLISNNKPSDLTEGL